MSGLNSDGLKWAEYGRKVLAPDKSLIHSFVLRTSQHNSMVLPSKVVINNQLRDFKQHQDGKSTAHERKKKQLVKSQVRTEVMNS